MDVPVFLYPCRLSGLNESLAKVIGSIFAKPIGMVWERTNPVLDYLHWIQESYNVVQPIGDAERHQVEQMTEEYIRRAEELFGQRFARVPVLFDLTGRTAGMFKVVGKRSLIRYNPWIFGKYFEENLRDTVPHEVAHYIVHEVYPRRGIKPHGYQWKSLMAQFGADPGVTFELDLAGVPIPPSVDGRSLAPLIEGRRPADWRTSL